MSIVKLLDEVNEVRAIHKGKGETATVRNCGNGIYLISYDSGSDTEIRESTLKRWWEVVEESDEEDSPVEVGTFSDSKSGLFITLVAFYYKKATPKRKLTVKFPDGKVLDMFDYKSATQGSYLYKDESREEVLQGSEAFSYKDYEIPDEEKKGIRRLRSELNKRYPSDWKKYVPTSRTHWEDEGKPKGDNS